MPNEMLLVLVKLKEMKYLGLKLLVNRKTILVHSLSFFFEATGED